MATTNTTHEVSRAAPAGTALLVSLPSLPHDPFDQVMANLTKALPGQDLLVATPDVVMGEARVGPFTLIGYTPAVAAEGGWTLTAADFLNAQELAMQHGARAVLQLGEEAQTLHPEALRGLVEAVLNGGSDLAVARYTLPPGAGLVNSAILYPMTRALFGTKPRFPLAIDLCVSARMAERMATVAQRFTASNQADALVWPVAEAATAAFTIAEIEVGTRMLPPPTATDLNTLLAHVTGSLFADVDTKAAFWQRARPPQAGRTMAGGMGSAMPAPSDDEVRPMLETFRLAYGNLQEIWSLVLPPQSLLGLKRLSVLPAESFVMQDSLWARIVYDFLLAFRLRTINRGHLLGALTPLYLAWAASHILQTRAGVAPERHVEAVAAAFEADKPYLVSRWRWPDRFNP